MYKLKSTNGRVNTLLRAGKDFVKNQLSISAAQHIADTGKLVESTNPDYPICVDDKWFFEGVKVEEPVKQPKKTNKKIGGGQA